MRIETDAEELPYASVLLGKQFRSAQPAAILLSFPHGMSDETTVQITLWARSLPILKSFVHKILLDIEKIQAENK